MSETEFRLYLKGIVVTVSHKHAFCIVYLRTSRKFPNSMGGTVCMFLIEDLRQFSGWSHISKQYLRQCISAFHSRIPAPDNCFCFFHQLPISTGLPPTNVITVFGFTASSSSISLSCSYGSFISTLSFTLKISVKFTGLSLMYILR